MRRTALLLAILALSGCAGRPAPMSDQDTSTIPASLDPSVAPGETWTALHFPGVGAINQTVWLNGTFQTLDACNPIGCATGAADRFIDISEYLPLDVPVTIDARLNYTHQNPAFGQGIFLGLFAPDPTIYSRTNRIDTPGRLEIQATLVRRTEPVRLLVEFDAPTEAAASIEYELSLDVRGDRTLIPGGVPVAVDLPGVTGLRAANGSTSGADRIRTLFFDPSDTFLGTTQTDQPFWTGSAASGEYVVAFDEHVPWIRLDALNGTPTMRVLDLRRSLGPSTLVADPQPIEWSFDVDHVPLNVGVYETNSSLFVFQAESSTATVTGPDGVLAEGPIGCGGVCLTGGQHLEFVRSHTGDEGNKPGSYKATYTPGAGAGAAVGYFVLDYQR